MSLDNEQVVREMDIDTNWNTLRIGIRGHVYYKFGSDADILFNPRFYLGLSNSNGVWSTSNHFAGLAYIAEELTYNSGTNTYKNEASTDEMYYNVIANGQTLYSSTSGQGHYFGATLVKRMGLFLEIQKGSPYNFRFFRSTDGTASDISDPDFNDVMNSDFDSASLTGYDYGDSGSYNVDENAYGDLDHICLAWNKSFMSVEVSQVKYLKIN